MLECSKFFKSISLFKKVGLNFETKDRTLLFKPRGAWRILTESGFCGGNTEQTAFCADHIFGSESDFVFWRCILKIARTEFCRATRGSGVAGQK